MYRNDYVLLSVTYSGRQLRATTVRKTTRTRKMTRKTKTTRTMETMEMFFRKYYFVYVYISDVYFVYYVGKRKRRHRPRLRRRRLHLRRLRATLRFLLSWR
jgi:hypothetical protein